MTTGIQAMREKMCGFCRLLSECRLTDTASTVILAPATAGCRKDDIEHLLPSIELIPYP